ncbi:hypothetical protein Hanom_Chr06g00531571 [Helianthus anomalus]
MGFWELKGQLLLLLLLIYIFVLVFGDYVDDYYLIGYLYLCSWRLTHLESGLLSCSISVYNNKIYPLVLFDFGFYHLVPLPGNRRWSRLRIIRKKAVFIQTQSLTSWQSLLLSLIL